jgi:O-antigen/teichoic acid export membrane protein
MPSPDRAPLRQRVFFAGAWSLAGYGLSQAIRFGSNLLMTRLLVPQMFGIVAIATLVQICLAMFSDLGLNLSVIQSKRGRDPAFLNTIWVTQIIRGVVLWFIALIMSLLLFFANRVGMVPANSVYADPSLPYVIAVLAVTAIIRGAQSTKLYEASRDLVFGRITQIDILAQLAGLLLMLGWAAIDRSIWALVAGTFCWSFVTTLLSHISVPGVTNRWEWDRSAFDQIVSFGKWIFLSSILGFLAINGDRVLLAGLVGATFFGVYVIAFSMLSAIDQILSKIITSVAYVALSETAREGRVDLKTPYYRFYVVIASCAYFCSGFLVVSGQSLIELLYDRRYEDAGWILQILAVSLLAIPSRLAIQCLLIFGLPNIFSHIGVVRLVSLYLSIPIGFHFFGFLGGLWAIVLASFSTVPVTIAYAVKYGVFDLRKELLLLPVIFAGAIVAMAFNLAVDHTHPVLRLFVSLIK